MATNKDPGFFEKMVRYSIDLHCIIDRTGYFVYVNEASTQMLGYEPQELIARKFTDFVRPEDLRKTLGLSSRIAAKQNISTFENTYIHKDGHTVPIEWSAVWSEGEAAYFCVGRDASEKKIIQQKLREKEELHRALVEYGADMMALLNEEGVYTYISGSTEKILGFSSEQLLGKSAFEFIHPADLPKAKEAFQSLLKAEEAALHFTGYRYKTANGVWKLLDTAINNQLQNPNIKALVVSSRDVSEQFKTRKQLLESEEKYRNLFEKNPDAVFHQNLSGTITEVNQAFQQVLGFRPEEVLNQPVSSFIPPESVALNTTYFFEALLGNTMRFDVELTTKKGDRKVFDMTMYPLAVNRKIIGVETIAKDITPMVRAYDTIKIQAQKLHAVLESITDAFFTVDNDLRFTFINHELERLLNIDRNTSLGHKIDEVFPKEILKDFYQTYQQVQETRESIAFEIFLKEKEMWLGVKFFPSENGLAVYLLDITERVNYQRELKMLSLVASKTTNGIVIMDPDGAIQWVNDGFTNLNGYTLEEVLGRSPSDVLRGPGTNPETGERIAQKFMSGEPFSDEILNYKKNGEEFWVKLNITPVKDNAGKIIRYVAIQTDVTEQKRADESQALLTQELYRQNRDLQQFTYIVSHNLRAPVANAIGLSSLLSVLDTDSDNFGLTLQNLDKSILSIDSVLKDLNQILSVGSKKDTLTMEAVDLGAICQEAIESMRESIEGFGAQVLLDVETGTLVYGNKPYLFSIFHNLLSNSIKYRSPERDLKIRIRATTNAHRVTVIFLDNGLGFDGRKAADKVFKLYKRFHRNVEGRGVGLFLVKTQIDAMGGEIEVASAENVGTRFLIQLRPGIEGKNG